MVLAGLVVVLAIVGVKASSASSASGPGGDNPISRATRQTIRIAIGGESSTIDAGAILHYGFDLPARACNITGRIVGISGGRKDFYAAIMTEDDYANFSTGHTSGVVWQTDPKTAAASINSSVQGPGRYQLVVSNAFSLFSGKVVTVAANVECP